MRLLCERVLAMGFERVAASGLDRIGRMCKLKLLLLLDGPRSSELDVQTDGRRIKVGVVPWRHLHRT
jgi:hypothetical protein